MVKKNISRVHEITFLCYFYLFIKVYVASHQNIDTLQLCLYRALISSKLDYGYIVYGSERPSYIKRLDTIPNQGLRLCLGAFSTLPKQSLLYNICFFVVYFLVPNYILLTI